MPRTGTALSEQDALKALAAGKKISHEHWLSNLWVAIIDGKIVNQGGMEESLSMERGGWYLWQSEPSGTSVWAVKLLSKDLKSAFVAKDGTGEGPVIQYSREWQEIPGCGAAVAINPRVRA